MNIKSLLYILISFLIATEGIFSGHKIGFIDIHRLIEVIIFVAIFKSFIYDFKTNKFLRTIIITTILFILLLFIKLSVLVFIKNTLEISVFIDIVRLLLMIIYIYLIFFLIQKNSIYLKLILAINSIIFLIALLQFSIFPFSDYFWSIKDIYFNQNTPLEKLMHEDRTRIVGLYGYAIPLIYSLISSILVTLYLYIKERKQLYLWYFSFLSLVGILSLTRSFLLTLFILIVYLSYILLLKSKILTRVISLIFIVLVSLYALNFYQKQAEVFDRISDTDNASYSSRWPLAMTGLNTLIKNPFGATKKDVMKSKIEMNQVYNNPMIFEFPSHVAILQLGLKYTVLGILLFFYMSYYIYTRFIQHFESSLKIFFVIAFLAYNANSLFHNPFIFLGDYFIFIIFAIMAVEWDNLTKEKA